MLFVILLLASLLLIAKIYQIGKSERDTQPVNEAIAIVNNMISIQIDTNTIMISALKASPISCYNTVLQTINYNIYTLRQELSNLQASQILADIYKAELKKLDMDLTRIDTTLNKVLIDNKTTNIDISCFKQLKDNIHKEYYQIRSCLHQLNDDLHLILYRSSTIYRMLNN